ncbi:MAG: ADP-ribosylglycohydrolase family protein [Archaeoglobaceae archaeon]|nr:ADP-ribosylglycohydrolase family protein [Archaeoglobaceae archaeon]MCX8151629.1 ADP-ribosylglycohydrolase family protein [Archaeoglobaceae archaeon]MDW8013093.1 ADP-ribosylglycohydrolase family protein [Archaeoglobaceae archaeon]
MLHKFERCLLGLAVGDALGMPVEGLSREQIKKIYGEINDFLPSPYKDLEAGEFTDDTEQALLVAEVIIENLFFDPEKFAEKLKNWFLRAKRIGPTSSKAIHRLLIGYDWRSSGLPSDTCGAATRVAPIGLVYSFNLDLVEKYAEISAIVTHRSDVAIAAASAVALAVTCNILGYKDDEMLEIVTKRIKDEILADKILLSYEIKSEGLDVAVEKIGNSISSYDTVPIAFYCFFSGKNFEESLKLAANAGGDTDSIAAICGALKGSAGFEIPRRWLEKLKDRERIQEISSKLFETHSLILS